MVMGISNGKSELEAVLQDMHDLLISKAADYTDGADQFSNFLKTGNMTGLGPEGSFKVLIATKVVRIMELTGSGRDPRNESVEDTLLDLANYAVLWLAWRRRNNSFNPQWAVNPTAPGQVNIN